MSSAIRIGSAGWNIPKESAKAFPADGSHLQRYSRVLNAMEINSSFYRPHKHETWKRWAETVPADFRFSVKASKSMTHEARLNCGAELLLPFLEQIGFLGDKLGPVLIQLPPSLEFDLTVATKFLSLLRENFRGDVVCEPRHKTWFADQANRLLEDFRVARVAADPACVPAAAFPGGDESLAYFRLHGSPRLYYSSYSDEFLNGLATQLRNRAERMPVWCIFDNTALGFGMQNALELKSKLER
jgi:uncharacterized protein YecE (DUF72 family)